MRRRKTKWVQPEWDCHQKTYEEVESELPNWILIKQEFVPLTIITGNSKEMKRRVVKLIEEIGFDWMESITNSGVIIVTNG